MQNDLRAGMNYREVLRRTHEDLRPRVYLEIGVHYGHSVLCTQPGTTIVGIDPAPQLQHVMPEGCTIVESTSDDFFDQHTVAELAGQPADMTFIDGLHVFEFSLRDFRNAERNSTPGSIILFHDCFPPADLAIPERSGDVWKVLLALREFRPDLTLHTVLSPPSGLGLVTGLDPTNTVLWDRYDEIVETMSRATYENAMSTHDLPVNTLDSRPFQTVRGALPPTPYRARSTSDVTRVALRRTRMSIRRLVKPNIARVKRRISR